LLYGSGDFHYLTALRLRRISQQIVLVSFDNHPDWDVRPPKWGCGGWVNRALELAHVRRVSVWGCGNFECWWPHQIFGNRRAEHAGILQVHPWADGRPAKDRQREGAILRDNWREHFEQFLKELAGENVYVTIDLDCLCADEAVTNWEAGRYTIVDLEWASIFAAPIQNQNTRVLNSASLRNSTTRKFNYPIRTRFAQPI